MKKVLLMMLVALMALGCKSTSTANFSAPAIEAQNASSDIPQREDIEEKYQWNLQDIYESNEAWQKDFDRISADMSKIDDFKGKVSKSGEAIAGYFSLTSSIDRTLSKLYVYAGLQKDLDTRISENQALLDKIQSLNVALGEKSSFFETELLTVPEKTLRKYFSTVPGLKNYQFYLDNLLRQQEHVLGDKEENLLAMMGKFAGTPTKIQEAIKYADMKYPKVKNDDGEMIQLTNGRYYQLLQSPNADIRRGAFEARNGAFNDVINTSATTFNAMLQKDLFYTKARKYNSTLERALSYDNVPVEVFDNLIETISNNLGSIHRYYALKKKVLGLEEMHLYDSSLPIVPQLDSDFPFEKAREVITEALKPLGEEYSQTIQKAFDNRWLDVYETEGKAGGAYSWGSFDSPHPYILLNYNNTQDNVFTVAHELGHTMHSYYSNKNQPYATASYTLFVAEVASTFNENLLMNYMLKNATTKEEKMILLDQWIQNIEGTIITQVQFAEFEKLAHEMAQNGVPITVESLNKTYHKLLEKYNGDSMIIDDLYDLTWSRIPHFYRTFYVYKYAVALSASTSLYSAVLADEPGAKENYINFLKSGGSDYSLNLLKKAGVDMSSPKPIEDTMKLLDNLVTQLEELFEES